jgi:tryptophanyl-tRNA synthetase
VPHVELTRELARRFNYVFGRDPSFEDKAETAIDRMGKKAARRYRSLRQAYVERGDQESLERARVMISEQQNITIGDRERLYGYLEGGGRIILPEPDALLTEVPRLPGLDGQKMSKSYSNTILMRDDPERVAREVRAMPTDPARKRRHDPGEPRNCPVFSLHEVYSTSEVKEWAAAGCRSAGIGCVDCKKPLIDEMLKEQAELSERARQYTEDPTLVKKLVADGCERARSIAEETMKEVRDVVGTQYS